MEALLKACRDGLAAELLRQYRSGSFSPVSFSQEAIFGAMNGMWGSQLGKLPDYNSSEGGYKFIDALKKTDTQKLLHAREHFDNGLMQSLTTSSTIKDALKQFQQSLDAHKEEMAYWAVIAPFAAAPAFLVGTVYQIVYDFVNTIISLLSFAGSMLSYAANTVYTAATGSEEMVLRVDIALLYELVPSIDLEQFFTEDVPAMLDSLISFVIELLNDYADHAEQWGKDTGSYILAVAGDSFNIAFSAFFDPMDPGAGVLGKAWWAIQQWFYLGTLIGPLVVDIVLFFCSGSVSGYFSAANKLGKLGKLDDIYKSLKVMDKLKDLKIVKAISDKWKESKWLTEFMERIYKKLIDLAMGAMDKLKSLIQEAYKQINRTDDFPELDKVMEKLDDLYDKAQNIDFLLSTSLLLIGSSINNQGELTIES